MSSGRLRIVADAGHQRRLPQVARAQVGPDRFGQQVRGVGQRVLERGAHAGTHLLDEHRHQQPRRQPDHQEIAEQDAQADLHAGSRL
jgi:hypothetical protein